MLVRGVSISKADETVIQLAFQSDHAQQNATRETEWVYALTWFAIQSALLRSDCRHWHFLVHARHCKESVNKIISLVKELSLTAHNWWLKVASQISSSICCACSLTSSSCHHITFQFCEVHDQALITWWNKLTKNPELSEATVNH